SAMAAVAINNSFFITTLFLYFPAYPACPVLLTCSELPDRLAAFDLLSRVDLHADRRARRNRLAGLDRLGDRAVVRTFAGERVAHRAVALVARVFVEVVIRLMGDRVSDGERRRIHHRILDVDAVVDHVGIDAREAFGDLELVAV